MTDRLMFIDAEEASRLDLSIMVLEELLLTHKFKKNTIGAKKMLTVSISDSIQRIDSLISWKVFYGR